METFDSDGVKIAYTQAGEGDPILLLHGFAASVEENWGRTGWVHALQKTGRRVIAFDHRGHGESEKLYEPDRYTTDLMAGDALRLMDHLKIERAELMGYSMGAGIAAYLAVHHGQRFSSVILGGIGAKMLEPSSGGDELARALEADDAGTLPEGMARNFRLYAEQTGQDLKALAACARGPKTRVTPEELGGLTMPVLVVAGQRDDLAGDPAALAQLIPGAKSEVIPGSDHMYTLPNGVFKGTVIDFLSGWL